MQTLKPQTHARSLVSAYELCDRLNIPNQNSHFASLWLDRNGITGSTVDEILNDGVAPDEDNPLLVLLAMKPYELRRLRMEDPSERGVKLAELVRLRIDRDRFFND